MLNNLHTLRRNRGVCVLTDRAMTRSGIQSYGKLFSAVFQGQKQPPGLDILADQILDIIGEGAVFLRGSLDSKNL